MSKTKIQTNKSEGRRYGLLSMLAMIVGVVIGSGIFAKNDELWREQHSALAGMITWFIVAILIIFMLISFIEIASITKKTKEQGTLSNWTRHLWGETPSKLIGFFFPIVYFPVLLSGLSTFAGNYLLDGISSDPIILGNMEQQWSEWTLMFVIGFGILIALYTMNSLTNRPGKIFQSVGTVVKLIPLFTIVILGIVVAIAPSVHQGASWDTTIGDIFDPSSALNPDWKGGLSQINIILLMLPAVMFSFDGFLFAATLQNEAKKPSTYKVAAISGVTFITIIYLSVTMFTYLSADPNKMDIGSAITSITGSPEAGRTVTFIIFISMITGISGNTITTQRMLAGLSFERYITDKKGLLIRRNNAGVPKASGFTSLCIALVWFIILRGLDAAVLSQSPMAPGTVSFEITGWATNMIVIGSFSIYTLIIIGGIKNRFTYSVYTERSKAFLPASFIIVPAMILINAYYIASIFAFNFDDKLSLITSVTQLTFLALFISIWLIVSFTALSRSKNATFLPQEEHNRRMYNFAYENILTVNEAKQVIKETRPSDLGFSLDVTMEISADKIKPIKKGVIKTLELNPKKDVKKPPTKNTPIKKPPAKKTPIKKAPVKKTPIKKVPVKKTPIKKAPVKKTPIKKPPAKKVPAKKPMPKKVITKKPPTKKTSIKKTPTKKNSVKK